MMESEEQEGPAQSDEQAGEEQASEQSSGQGFEDGAPDPGSRWMNYLGVAAQLQQLVMRLWAQAQSKLEDPEEVQLWFAQWVPALAAARKLVTTLGSFAFHLQLAWRRSEGGVDPGRLLPQGWGLTLQEQLRELFEAFPDVATIMLGTLTIDEVLETMVLDEEGRLLVDRLLGQIEANLDAIMSAVVDLALSDEASDKIATGQMVAFIERIEGIVQRLIEEHLLPKLFEARGIDGPDVL